MSFFKGIIFFIMIVEDKNMKDDDFFGGMNIEEVDDEKYKKHPVEFIINDGILTKVEYMVYKTELIIPEGVVKIADRVLDALDTMDLERIVFPSTLVDVGEENFTNNSSLKEVVINDNFVLENGCLYSKNYKKLFFCMQNTEGELKVKEGCEYICSFAFTSCKGLIKVVFPNTVKHIGIWCFSNCDNLKDVVLPKFIDNLEDTTFSNCFKLKKVNMPENLKIIPNALFDCCKIKRLKLPESIKEIETPHDRVSPLLYTRIILSKENKKIQNYCHKYGIKYEFENDKECEVEEAKNICNKLSGEFIKLFKKTYSIKDNKRRKNACYELQRVLNKVLAIKIKGQGYIYDNQIRNWFLMPDESVSLFDNNLNLFRYYDKFCSYLLVTNWVVHVICEYSRFFLEDYDY